MVPQDPNMYASVISTEWIAADERWFELLTAATEFTIAEKIHLAQLALQQQWACDVAGSARNRAALRELGLHVAATESGFLVVSGSPVLADYIRFRSNALTTVEAGVFYGYPSSAVLAFTGVLSPNSPQGWPASPAEYYLGGVYSRDSRKQELDLFARQWSDLETYIPEICRLADIEFRSTVAPS